MKKKIFILLSFSILLCSPNLVLSDCLDFGGFTNWEVQGDHTILFYRQNSPLAKVNLKDCKVTASSTVRLMKNYVCDSSIFESDVLQTASFAVPSGILEAGKTYYFRANSLDFDPSELIGGVEPPIQSRVENRAIEYAEFQPVPEPATMLLLSSGLIGLAGYGRKKFFKK